MEATAPSPKRRLPAGRKADLASYVEQVGEVTVGGLAEHFHVSIDTIRRDLDQLDREGVVIRTHGGAVSAEGQLKDRALDVRLRMQTEEKETIARLAAGLIDDGAVVMLNAGTTTLAPPGRSATIGISRSRRTTCGSPPRSPLPPSATSTCSAALCERSPRPPPDPSRS